MWLLPLLLLLFVTAARSCEFPCQCVVERHVQRDNYYYLRIISTTVANCSDGGLTAPPVLVSVNVIKVILANNQIKALGRSSFGISSYHSTHSLDLSNNLISSMDPSTFDNFDYIKDINLSNNLLSSIPRYVFKDKRELTMLHLSGNPLILPTDQPFLTSSSLEFLILSNCNLTTIYLESFKDLPQVHSLDLSDNKLGVVNTNVFLNLNKLIQLDIYGNPNLRLQGRDNLTVDTLMMGNACSWLKEDAYLGIPNARQVHLDGCALEEFPAHIISTAKELNYLDLSNNRISRWSETINGVENLLRLNLHGNNIGSLPKDAFSSSPELRFLNISSNQIDVAPDGSFLNIHWLVNLDLRNCSVTQLNGLTFSNMINLMFIDLSNNKIKSIRGEVFSGLKNLTKLLLADNALQFLDSNAFIENDELLVLDLSRNPLLLPSSNNSFLVSNSIQILFLREMNILKFEHLLYNITELKSVDVTGNNISTIQFSDIKVIKTLQLIVLNNNPILCDAKMQKVYFWTKEQNISVEATCRYPKGNWLLLEHMHFSENETYEEIGKNEKQISEYNTQASSSKPDNLSPSDTADTESAGVGGGSIAAILISGIVIGAIVGSVLMVLFGKRFFIYGGFPSVRLHNVDSLED